MLLNSYLKKYVHNSRYSWKSTERNYIGPKYETQFVKFVVLTLSSNLCRRRALSDVRNLTELPMTLLLVCRGRRGRRQSSAQMLFRLFFNNVWCTDVASRCYLAASRRPRFFSRPWASVQLLFFYDIWSACEYRLTCVVAKLDQFREAKIVCL